MSCNMSRRGLPLDDLLSNMPRDPVGPPADSNDDSNGVSPLPRTCDNIQPRSDLISRTGSRYA